MRILRTLLIVTFLLACAASAQATDITVTQHTIPNWQRTTSNAYLYVFYSETFTASDGTVVLAGNQQNRVSFKRVTCTYSGGTLTIPSFTIPSTRDGIDRTSSRVSFAFYTLQNSFIQMFSPYTDLTVPSAISSATGCSPSGTCCSFAELLIWSQGSPALPADTFYNKTQVDRLIAGVTAGTSAPLDATYLTATSNPTLTAEVVAGNPIGVAFGGLGASLAATGGANQFLKQPSVGGTITVGTVADADVPNTITLDNITQITTRSHTSLTDIGTNSHAAIDTFIASKASPSGLASLDGSSLVVQNPANATATPTASKIPISDGGGLLANGWLDLDLQAIAGLSTSGVVVRTGSGTASVRTIIGTSNKITVTDGDGVSGNPTLTIGSDVVDKTLATSYTAGAKQTFLSSATTAGINWGAVASDPSSLSNGDTWYDSTNHVYKGRANGVTISFGTGSPPFSDTTTLVQGSADSSKLLRFEIDGFTTATTRVLTPQNANYIVAGIDISNTWSAKQTFTPTASVAGLNVGSVAGDPSTPVNGDIWYDSSGNFLRARINGSTVSLGAAGGSSPPFADTTDIVQGSADASKRLRFEIDGFTAAATRTLTPQNASYTIAGTDVSQTFGNTQTFTNPPVLTGVTTGSVLFSNGGTIAQDNTNLFFDDTLNALKAKFWDKGGQVFNVMDQGAVADGTTDTSTAIQATIDAAEAAGGGVVWFPQATSSYAIATTLTVGNGSGNYGTGAATASTQNNIVLAGPGAQLKWTGAASGVMVSINGPIKRAGVRGLRFDCNSLAATALDLNHPEESAFEDILIENNTNGWAVQLQAYQNPTGTVNGANNNRFSNIRVTSTQAGAKGLTIGTAAVLGVGILDVAKNKFDNIALGFNTGGGFVTGSISLRLQFTDYLTFTNLMTGAETGIQVKTPSGTGGGGRPDAITFIHPSLSATTSFAVDETSGNTWAPADKFSFFDYHLGDSEQIPTDITNNFGVDTKAQLFGPWTLKNARYLLGRNAADTSGLSILAVNASDQTDLRGDTVIFTNAAGTEQARKTSAGFWGLGLTSPAQRLDANGSIGATIGDSTGTGPSLALRYSRGVIGTPIIVNDGDTLGTLDFYGSDGASYLKSGRIRVLASGAPGSGFVPTAMVFDTATTAGVLTEAFRITNAQSTIFNSSTVNNTYVMTAVGRTNDTFGFRVVGNPSSAAATAGAGIHGGSTVLPTATGQTLAFYSFGSSNGIANTTTNAAIIIGASTEAWTIGANQGASLFFGVTAAGTASRTNEMELSDTGILRINGPVGTPTTGTKLHVMSDADVSAILTVDSYGDTNGTSSNILLRHARGTSGTPTAVTSGTSLGWIAWGGHDSSSLKSVDNARIEALAGATWTGSDNEAELYIQTTLSGATTKHTAVIITGESNIKVPTHTLRGTTEGTNQLVLINGTAPVGTLTNGISLFSESGHAIFADAAGLYQGTRAIGRATGQIAANSSVATYTVGAADGSFEVSANVLVTTATTHTFTVQCTYTDEGNTARTVTMPMRLVGDTTAITTSITNANGTVPYNGIPLHIRAKAGTAITILTQAAGTYTTVVYNVEGVIRQLS